MAIQDKNNTQSEATQQASMSQNFASKQEVNRGEVASSGFSFRNMGNLNRAAMGRTPASEVLSKLNKALTEVFTNDADKSFEITLIPIDLNATTQLNVSVLVVALRDRQALEVGVAFHTLIVEGSIEQPAPRFTVINGINTEITRTVGDARDAVMMQVVSDYVARSFPNSTQLNADTCVVPRDFNVTDTTAVYALAANALFATSSELQIQTPNFVDLNLANAERDSNLTVRTTFGNSQINNAVGQPIRSDVNIDFAAAPVNANQDQQAVERVSSIARVSGFMDLIWFPNDVQQNAYFQQAPANYQRYASRFVVTALESTQLLTIPAQLLALVSAMSLAENNKWVQAYRRNGFGDVIDMHDIGAIGLEVNFENNPNGIGTRIDTKSASFKPEHLQKLIATTVRPGMVLSLDVPECGPETWYNGVFGAAAQGNPNAVRAIIDAANTLTNGAFANYFPLNAAVAIDEFNRIHLGHYTDSNGVRRDIRDIDYVAIANLVGEKDPQIIKDWSDTFAKTEYPLDLRLAARKRIISNLFTDTVFTGFATRVTFTPDFQSALIKGCQDAGLSIRSVDSYADNASFERATSSFANAVLGTGNVTGLFNSGYNRQANAFQQHGRFTDRW